MDSNNNIFGWVLGVVVVLLVVAGIWWFAQGNSASTIQNPTATTTPNGSATTTETGGQGGTPVATETRSSTTVNGLLASLPNVSQFAALYASTGVQGSVTGQGPYTLFVPTNSAFSNLPPGTLSNMTAAQKQRLVQYHVVAGKMLDFDGVSAGNHQALSKDTLNFNINPQNRVAYVNSGYAITQYKTSNGIVYVINAVLVPPQTPSSTTGATGSPVPR